MRVDIPALVAAPVGHTRARPARVFTKFTTTAYHNTRRIGSGFFIGDSCIWDTKHTWHLASKIRWARCIEQDRVLQVLTKVTQ